MKLNEPKFARLNESLVRDMERPNSELNIHSSNVLRNSFILEEEEEKVNEGDEEASKEPNRHHEDVKKRLDISSANDENSFELPFPELVYINLADNQVT